MYLIRTPRWLRLLYPGCIWHVNTKEKVLYLTFDDGPHPVITPFVLEELKKANAKATFFCIGKNVNKYPDIYKRIQEEGHSIGNHTYNHLNAWKNTDADYLDDVEQADLLIKSNLFRPPYGRINSFIVKQIYKRFELNTVMWTVLSGDFDTSLTPGNCLKNVVLSAEPGAIIVFHDSEKAYERLKYALPETLDYFTKKDYRFERLEVP